MLYLIDIRASYNFVTHDSAERTELRLEELKAPIEVNFVDGVSHPIML
jgi:hypothetical protein